MSYPSSFNKVSFIRSTGLCLLLASCVSSCFGQSFNLLGDEYKNASSVLAPIGVKSNLYKPAANDSNANQGRLFFTPFFVFKADHTGKLAVREEQSTSDPTKYLVRLTLLVSPQDQVDKIAATLRQEEASLTPPGAFVQITSSDLIPLTMKDIHIKPDVNASKFEDVTLSGVLLPTELPITSQPLVKAEADDLCAKLGNGTITPTFLTAYTLNAVLTSSSSQADVRIANAYNTQSTHSLVGGAPAFEWHISDTGGSLAANDQAVTRDQRDEFKGTLQREIQVAYHVEDPADFGVLQRQVDAYVNGVFQAKQIAVGDHFAADIAKLSSYGFSPSDLQPDQFNKLIADIKTALQTHDTSHIDVNTAAKVGVLDLFDASGSAHVTSDELHDRMVQKGWNFRLEGTAYAPKSLTVYVVDQKALREQSTLAISVDRASRGNVELSALSTTDQVLPIAFSLAQVPLGTIIDWYRFDAQTPVPYGYQICDGNPVSDAESPFAGKPTPNLIDRFTMGVPETRVGELGGSNTLPPHTHTFDGQTSESDTHVGGYQPGKAFEQQGDHLQDHYHHFAGSTNGTQTNVDSRPKHIGVLKLMRVE